TRARGLVQIGKRTLKEINIQDNNNKLERQEELFTTPLGEKMPEPGSLKGCWEDDVLKIPFFRTQDLYNYLVLNRSRTFDNQNMNARKQLKAKVFYEDGHVHSVKYNQISHKCSHCYVRAKVIPSLPVSAVKKRIMNHGPVCLKYREREGESCNHVAALLYALVDIGSKQKDGLNAPTSTKCKWNQPNDSKLVAPEEPIPVLHKLHSVDFFYKDSVDLKSSICENNFETYFKSLNCKQDDGFLLKTQQKEHKSCHWKNARAGRLTSYSFGTICKKKPETKPDILLRSIMGYNDEFDTAATRWDRSHEPAAKRVYQRRIQITHPGLELFSSGLVVKPSLPHLGSIPDGIVDCCKKCAHNKG
ncbi:hypothetical protein MAR_012434, partial [Mya arenaria]